MKIPDFIHKYTRVLKTTPKRVWIIAAASVVVASYSLVFFIPKKIELAYSDPQTCVGHFAFAPDTQKQSGDDKYQVSLNGGWAIFGNRVTSTQLCVTPMKSPEEGTASLRIAPFGGIVASKLLNLKIPSAPKASVQQITGKSISAARELTVPLTATDVLHGYTLRSNDKMAECSSKDAQLHCNVPALQLAHGADYVLSMYRSFKGSSAEKVSDINVKTLTAIQMTDSTVKNDQVVYDMPTELSVSFDKPLKAATAALIQEKDGTKSPIPIKVAVQGSQMIVTLSDQLPRTAQFSLEISDVEGEDGSSLANPIIVRFTTSGGPKPSNVSVGSSGVGQNAQITVTFDQPLKSDVDVTKLARVTGVNGTVRKVSDTQIAFALQAAPLCAGFSLVIDKAVPSGSNNEVSADAWKFDSRIVCGTSAVIGTSVRGRPIIAHYFGNGSTTLLFTGAIHGTEVSSYTTMQAWVAYLQSNPVPADKRIVVIPNTNPDGVASGTRNNANNVNVDRNFPSANWSASIDTASGILPQGGGTSAGSEPEAQALIKITRQLRPRLSISFHSQGRLVGANKYGDSVSIGNTYAATVGYGTMFDNAEDVMGYSITGEYEDWMGEELGVPAILIELPSHSGNYLNTQLPALKKILSV